MDIVCAIPYRKYQPKQNDINSVILQDVSCDIGKTRFAPSDDNNHNMVFTNPVIHTITFILFTPYFPSRFNWF